MKQFGIEAGASLISFEINLLMRNIIPLELMLANTSVHLAVCGDSYPYSRVYVVGID